MYGSLRGATRGWMQYVGKTTARTALPQKGFEKKNDFRESSIGLKSVKIKLTQVQCAGVSTGGVRHRLQCLVHDTDAWTAQQTLCGQHTKPVHVSIDDI